MKNRDYFTRPDQHDRRSSNYGNTQLHQPDSPTWPWALFGAFLAAAFIYMGVA
jgi:hypothetical protein